MEVMATCVGTTPLTAELSPAQLFDWIARRPTIAIIDCRSVLRVGLLPRTRVLRCKRGESYESALEALIDEMMWEAPPGDRSAAIVVGERGYGEDAPANVAAIDAACAYLRAHLGATSVYGLAGGVTALHDDGQYAFLLGMSAARAAALPARLGDCLLLGSAASALDAPALAALGVTHVLSVLNAPLHLSHVPAERHLAMRAGGVASERGTDGLHRLLNGALPFILRALAANSAHCLLAVHPDETTSGAGGEGSASAAAAVACAAMVAHGSPGVSLDHAAAKFTALGRASALHPQAMSTLRRCEAWLADGAQEGQAPAEPEAELQAEAMEVAGAANVGVRRELVQPSVVSARSAAAAAGDQMQRALRAHYPSQVELDDEDEDFGEYAG